MSNGTKQDCYLMLPVDFHEEPEIIKMVKMKKGYVIYLVYFRLMLESVNNEGSIFYLGHGRDLRHELAVRIGMSLDYVELALDTLADLGLVEESEDEVFFPYAYEHIGSDGEFE